MAMPHAIPKHRAKAEACLTHVCDPKRMQRLWGSCPWQTYSIGSLHVQGLMQLDCAPAEGVMGAAPNKLGLG